MRYLAAIGFALCLVGCSSTKVEATGEFFKLTNRNVITRDLTRPVGVDNEPTKYEYRQFPQSIR